MTMSIKTPKCLGMWVPGDYKCSRCNLLEQCKASRVKGGSNNAKGIETRRELRGGQRK